MRTLLTKIPSGKHKKREGGGDSTGAGCFVDSPRITRIGNRSTYIMEG